MIVFIVWTSILAASLLFLYQVGGQEIRFLLKHDRKFTVLFAVLVVVAFASIAAWLVCVFFGDCT